MGEASLELREAAVFFVDPVEHRAAIEPEGDPVGFFVCEFYVVVTFLEEREKFGGAGSELAGGRAVIVVVVPEAPFARDVVVGGIPVVLERFASEVRSFVGIFGVAVDAVFVEDGLNESREAEGI